MRRMDLNGDRKVTYAEFSEAFQIQAVESIKEYKIEEDVSIKPYADKPA